MKRNQWCAIWAKLSRPDLNQKNSSPNHPKSNNIGGGGDGWAKFGSQTSSCCTARSRKRALLAISLPPRLILDRGKKSGRAYKKGEEEETFFARPFSTCLSNQNRRENLFLLIEIAEFFYRPSWIEFRLLLTRNCRALG